MLQVPDPIWKRDPDIVAEETARERYIFDDNEEEEERDEEL